MGGEIEPRFRITEKGQISVANKASLQFLGAAGGVTGSKYLFSYGADQLLIDCGLFQGLKELRLRNWAPVPFDLERLRAIVLTHAHIDHSGYLPRIVSNGSQRIKKRATALSSVCCCRRCNVLMMSYGLRTT